MRTPILSCVFGSILLTLLFWVFNVEAKELPNVEFLKRIEESNTSVVYVLDKKKWTEFPLPPGTSSIKIVTNVDLPAGITVKPTDSWNYAIEYQLIDKNGKVVKDKEFHFVATLKKYIDKRFSEPITASFYFNLTPVPSDAKVAVLNFEGTKDISSLRVRAKSMDPVIKNIILRISVNEAVAESKLSYLWLRMSSEQKTMIATGNIYPQELLLENEIHNLMTIQKKPLGPAGIPGRDYISRTLYVSKELEAEEIPPPIMPSGVFIDEVVHGVIPIPEGNHMLRLKITSAGFGKDPSIGSKIHIRWIGRIAQERLAYDLNWDGTEISWEHVFKGGLLEITASGQLIARVYMVDKKTEEITPLHLYVRTYISDKGLPIQYKINHIGNKPTLFRINLSFLMPPEGKGVKTPTVHYSLLDKKGRVLKTGILLVDSLHSKIYDLCLLSTEPTEIEKHRVVIGDNVLIIKKANRTYYLGFLKEGKYTEEKIKDKVLIDQLHSKTFDNEIERDKNIINMVNSLITSLEGQSPSNYDRVAYEPFEQRVSNSDAYFFSLPQEVTTIKFSSDQPLLLDAYNRPYDLIREIKVPEDSYFDDPTRYRQPDWYALKPIDDSNLILSNRSVLLTRQYKPAEENPELLEGNYEWKDYHPNGNWLGRNLLTPLEDLRLLREDALPNVYRAISTNKNVFVDFHSLSGTSVVEPNIAYTRLKTGISPLRIYIDGQLNYQGVIDGTSGEIRLPALKRGIHHIMVQSNEYTNTKFYVNYVPPSSGDMLKRLVNKLDTKELTFDYEKNDKMDELLSIRFYTPNGISTRSIIGVRVDAPQRLIGPLHNLSFLNRQFNVRPNLHSAIFVLGADNQKVDEGEIFSIPLKEDLPPGKYQVHIYLVKGVTGYVSLSRIVPGNFEQRWIFVEPEIRNEHSLQ